MSSPDAHTAAAAFSVKVPHAPNSTGGRGARYDTITLKGCVIISKAVGIVAPCVARTVPNVNSTRHLCPPRVMQQQRAGDLVVCQHMTSVAREGVACPVLSLIGVGPAHHLPGFHRQDDAGIPCRLQGLGT